MKVIDECINKFRTKLNTNNNNDLDNKLAIKLYYENQMNSNYKKDEKIMKDIVKRNVKTTDINSKLTSIIYYCNTKVNN